jgi:hypothetical protein
MLCPARVFRFPIFVRADVDQGRGAAAQFQSGVVREISLMFFFASATSF